ncbi:MAG: hydantoinase/carbamoylase family amidase [Streptosporangiales bacterium]|nr:hydantoinase/carbamoylase family amidase [Streptosporangiales bacterium]
MEIPVSQHVSIDRTRSAERIGRDIETLAGPAYTSSERAICRYAYTDVYRNTLDYFRERLGELGFRVYEDPVGNLVARNRPPGEPVFGLGSHCDSNRNGGKYDGTMGVVTALEVCRLDAELGLGLPLQLISFLEEEGSGFGQMLLGSRIVAGRVTERALRQDVRAIDDGRSFWEHAEEAGYQPSRWPECAAILDDLTGWLELHIEQGRVLQDAGHRVGVVSAIAGYVHADVEVRGRADHAGATPMDLRLDAGTVAAASLLELQRLARRANEKVPTVGTVGEVSLDPGLINVVPGGARFSLDIRGVDDRVVGEVFHQLSGFAHERAGREGMTATVTERQTVPVTPMDARIISALEGAAGRAGEPYTVLHSGAAHDTMSVAGRVPAGMVFVACRDGVSHSPEEEARPEDAAVGAEVMLNAIAATTES